MANGPVILWFRQDLRLDDNPALAAALETGAAVLPLYIRETSAARWAPGAASRWWLHHSLKALESALASHGCPLLVQSGEPAEVLERLVRETGAQAVYWNRQYEPEAIARDTGIKEALRRAGIEARSHNAALLFEPQTIRNKQGTPFQVFTPYWRHCLGLGFAPPLASRPKAGARIPTAPLPSSISALPIEALELLPRIPWDAGFGETWTPGEDEARARLKAFLKSPLSNYDEGRDLPASKGVSRLSPHLHFGEIGPRRIVAAIRQLTEEAGVFPADKGSQRFLAELGWREFSHHLLFHFPQTATRPLRPEFERFPWAEDKEGRLLRAWQKGLTGYPIVDAGMRQLWHTGWMHNRVRMIVASFLVKHLRLPWQRGAEWFWDTLVDADLPANTLGWQWSAGCGADAAPYFRIFNPILQGEKFDADGQYVKKWIPELARLPVEWLHKPWEAPASVLGRAGVELGKHYPGPLVDHARARKEALEALASLKKD